MGWACNTRGKKQKTFHTETVKGSMVWGEAGAGLLNILINSCFLRVNLCFRQLYLISRLFCFSVYSEACTCLKLFRILDTRRR